MPAVVAAISAMAPTTQNISSTHSSVSSTSDNGSPVTIVSSPPRACRAMSR